MRIGLIIYGSLETVTGGFLYDRMLVEHLRGQGDQVEVVSLPWRSYGLGLGHNLSRSLFSRLRDAPFDILLQDELAHPSLFWLNRRVRRAARYPIVAIIHLLRSVEPRPAWQNRLYGWIERRYLRSVDGFIWNSQATRGAAEALAGQVRPGVVACPGGDHLSPAISTREIGERAQEAGPLRVLFVGNVSPVKGLHTLVEALSHMPSGAWRLSVIGSLTTAPGYVRAVRKQADRSGVSDCIELLGALPNAQVAAHLERSQVLAVPSAHEAFGIAYLEAMGFGLPVIASAQGAAGEVLSHGQEGFLVAPGDAEALAQHLTRLHQDRGLLASMGIQARERYAAHPSWADSGRAVRNFLHGLARGA